jgi:hypothetical protein
MMLFFELKALFLNGSDPLKGFMDPDLFWDGCLTGILQK